MTHRKRNTAKMENPARNAHATVTAVNAVHAATAVNVKSAQTCVSQPKPLRYPC